MTYKNTNLETSGSLNPGKIRHDTDSPGPAKLILLSSTSFSHDLWWC